MGSGASGGFPNTRGSDNIHGFPKKLHEGKQGKHIPGHNNYQAGKSIFYGTMQKAQELINKFAGTGEWIGNNKERVNFGEIIGRYINTKKILILTQATESFIIQIMALTLFHLTHIIMRSEKCI